MKHLGFYLYSDYTVYSDYSDYSAYSAYSAYSPYFAFPRSNDYDPLIYSLYSGYIDFEIQI